MKCLPRSKVPSANGNILHDCHAEVLAIRAFNRFLIYECESLARTGGSKSSCLKRQRTSDIPDNEDPVRPFAMREGISFHMYCSEAPCGDASMELVMRAQDDPTPWDNPPALDRTTDDCTGLMMGRGYFSQLGIVRRKPCEHYSVVSITDTNRYSET
jgi:tRNA-specific adenosine deaminase 1